MKPKIHHCTDCKSKLLVGINITASAIQRSQYRCKHCKSLRMGASSTTLSIEKQLAHGMKIYRVQLVNWINSLTGKVGRPPKLLPELHLQLKALDRAIRNHSK